MLTICIFVSDPEEVVNLVNVPGHRWGIVRMLRDSLPQGNQFETSFLPSFNHINTFSHCTELLHYLYPFISTHRR